MYLREKQEDSKRIRKIAREDMNEEQRREFLRNPKVSIEFLVNLCLEDAELYHVIASEMYIFVEGRVVRNKPQYFINTDGKLELSRYALLHAKDCMLNSLFIEKYKPDSVVAFRGMTNSDDVEVVGTKKFDSNQAETSEKRNQLKYAEKVGIKTLYDVSIDLNALVDKAVEDYRITTMNLPTFSQEICKIICDRKIDVRQFVENTHLTPVIYGKLKTQTDYIPIYRHCIAVCFGLHLELEHTEQLLKVAGYALRNAPETAIFKIFWTIRHFNINDLNNCLLAHGCEPLGTISKDT